MKISLIIATYNSASTIKDTLDSILKQSYQNFEIVVVDGKSTDDTISIVRDYQQNFGPRLRFISERDKGIYDAMNKGILMSSGDVIGILNSDDFYTNENVLSIIAEAFKQYQIDAVYGDVHFVRPDNLNKQVRYYSSKIFRPYLMRLGFMPAHPTFYIKKEYFTRLGLYKTDYKIASDFEFLLRAIFIHKIKILYLHVDMVTMRTGGVSTSGLKSHEIIMREHLRAFKENGIYTNRFLLSLRYFYKLIEIIKR